MINLLALKQHLILVRRTTLSQAARYFKSEPAMVRELLEFWRMKGKLRKAPQTEHCLSECSGCPSDSTEIYEWVDS